MLVLPNHLLSIILKQFSNKLPELQKPQLRNSPPQQMLRFFSNWVDFFSPCNRAAFDRSPHLQRCAR